jgi:hypothetical protein
VNDPKLPVTGEDATRALVVTPPAEDRYIHSDIFERLVRDQDDIPGLVAYGIYQIRKREWVDKHEKQYGCLPPRDDVKKYSFTWGDGALDSLRHEAEARMFRFAENVVESQYNDLMKNAFNEQTVTELGEVKKLVQKQGGFLHHIIGHIVGFVALVFITALVLYAIGHEPSISGAVDWIKSHF